MLYICVYKCDDYSSVKSLFCSSNIRISRIPFHEVILHVYITNPQNDQLPVGLFSSVDKSAVQVFAGVMGSNPVLA